MFGKFKLLMKIGKGFDFVFEIESVIIGWIVFIDQFVFDLFGESMYLEFVLVILLIIVQGLVNLFIDGEMIYVYCFYIDDDVMFQVMMDVLDGGNVQEVFVFMFFDSVYFNIKVCWKEWEDFIKVECFEMDDGLVFECVWFEGELGLVEFVCFWEIIYDD